MDNRLYGYHEVQKIRADAYWKGVFEGRKALIEEALDEYIDNHKNDVELSVTQKSETVTEFADRCRECGARYGKLLKQKSGHWIVTEDGFECSECGCISRSQADCCQYCGCSMVEPQKSEDKE